MSIIHDMNPIFDRRHLSWWGLFLWVAAFNTQVSIAVPGPDFGHYLQYAQSLLRANYIFRTGTLSPTGHIVCHHSLGAALFWVPFLGIGAGIEKIFHLHAWFPGQYAFFSQWVFMPVMMVLLVRLCRAIGAGPLASAMAIFLGFFGTPLFLHTIISVSSEFMTAFSSVVFLYGMLHFDPTQNRHYVYLGILGALTALIRYDNVIFVMLVFAFIALGQFFNAKNFKWLSSLAVGAVVFAFGCLPIFVLNYLFTGNFLQSPLLAKLPSGELANVDYSSGHLGSVLFSPWHGLFSYNPLFFVVILSGLFYLACDFLRVRSGGGNFVRAFFTRPLRSSMPWIFAVYFALRLVMLSFKEVWWGGLSFGGRYFMFFFPPAILCLAYLFKVAQIRRLSHPLFGLLLASVIWTFFLCFAQMGRANFYTYGQLFHAEKAVFLGLLGGFPVVTVIWLNSCILIPIMGRYMTENGSCWALGALTLIFLILIDSYFPKTGITGENFFVSIFLLVFGWISLRFFSGGGGPEKWKKTVFCSTASLYAATVVFCVGAGWNSLRVVRSQPVQDYRYCGTFEAQDWIESFFEYSHVDGYLPEKMKYHGQLKGYLDYLLRSRCFEGRPNLAADVEKLNSLI